MNQENSDTRSAAAPVLSSKTKLRVVVGIEGAEADALMRWAAANCTPHKTFYKGAAWSRFEQREIRRLARLLIVEAIAACIASPARLNGFSDAGGLGAHHLGMAPRLEVVPEEKPRRAAFLDAVNNQTVFLSRYLRELAN